MYNNPDVSISHMKRRINMAKGLKSFGVMLDMSRNAVMSIPALKRYLPILKKMGYNTLFLYVEDTYEVDGEEYFGYMRGRYSKTEMKELDAFCTSIGIEVIPCIQTLAHLNATLRWGKIPVDCDDILLADDPRTYEMIDHMFTTLAECFATRRIHIGMDEAHMLGRGKHLDKFGYEHSSSIIKRHLEKICEIASKFNYEVMLWSDMFFRSWENDGGYYFNEVVEVPKQVVESVPESVIPVFWDYYHEVEEQYDIMFEMHRQLSKKVWFAGGVWSWGGFMPHNSFGIRMMGPAMRSCRKYKVKNIFITMWGDDGAECSKFAMLPSLFYVSEVVKGNEDMNSIKEKFVRFTGGITFDEFMMLDAPNNILDSDSTEQPTLYSAPVNPSKYMLYSDYFNGFLDYTVVPGASAKYAEYAVELAKIAKKSRKFGYLFNTAAKLCEALAVKYELGVKTREAYQNGDKDTLRALAENDYVKAEKLINAFALAFEKQWFAENKPCGFDIQDGRLGAIIRRTSACRRRLLDYVNGRIDEIPELAEKLLPFGKKQEPIYMNHAKYYMSTNVISH